MIDTGKRERARERRRECHKTRVERWKKVPQNLGVGRKGKRERK